jgi:hypothetical protein
MRPVTGLIRRAHRPTDGRSANSKNLMPRGSAVWCSCTNPERRSAKSNVSHPAPMIYRGPDEAVNGSIVHLRVPIIGTPSLLWPHAVDSRWLAPRDGYVSNSHSLQSAVCSRASLMTGRNANPSDHRKLTISEALLAHCVRPATHLNSSPHRTSSRSAVCV